MLPLVFFSYLWKLISEFKAIEKYRPRTQINKENVDVLQLLDLLKDFEQYVDEDMVAATYIISSYIKKIGMKRSDVDKYITLFPDRVYKYIYEMRLYNVFA